MARSIKNLTASFLMAISLYLAWTQILPLYMTTSFLKEKIIEKQDLLASRLEVLDAIAKLKEERNSKYAQIQRLALVIPEKKSLPELITAVESIYSKSGFILAKLGLGVSTEPEQLGKIGIKTDAEGTYVQLLNFLSYFERNIRLFDINKIELGTSRSSESLADINNPLLGLTVDGHFYWIKQPELGASRITGEARDDY